MRIHGPSMHRDVVCRRYMMSGKRRRQQMSATHCRASVAILGLLLAGGSVAFAAFAALANGSVSSSAIMLAC
ncbi:hypothetical protein O1K_00360 [Xanthomonas fragariae LMG 25863]|nr:hypothetical protein O1K_00360 [Xanthomonas fragariae LMG 25863]